MIPHFYYSPESLKYDFGPQHPLKPERLRRTIEILERYEVETIDPGEPKIEDLLRVHSEEYVAFVQELSRAFQEGRRAASDEEKARRFSYGFSSGDNPAFPGMFEAAASYSNATAKAAEAVRDGAPLAFGIAGGLHHAQRERASGFCIFDDPAIACDILLERFERVAYIDIDVHHGDGVQWIFYDDPRVLTCSIHESGRTLFPGTGDVTEIGAKHTSFNVPIQAHTTGDVWLDAFKRTVPKAIEAFEPGAIVLQMGTDTHYLDPLAHIRCTQQEWLAAVHAVKEIGLPIVAVGGGGYNLTTVPRMWVSACLTLGDVPFEDELPEELGPQWGMTYYSDLDVIQPSFGQDHAEAVIEWLEENHLPNIGK